MNTHNPGDRVRIKAGSFVEHPHLQPLCGQMGTVIYVWNIFGGPMICIDVDPSPERKYGSRALCYVHEVAKVEGENQ